jgi:hypothetical protein
MTTKATLHNARMVSSTNEFALTSNVPFFKSWIMISHSRADSEIGVVLMSLFDLAVSERE